jgi:hypothetical protein
VLKQGYSGNFIDELPLENTPAVKSRKLMVERAKKIAQKREL